MQFSPLGAGTPTARNRRPWRCRPSSHPAHAATAGSTPRSSAPPSSCGFRRRCKNRCDQSLGRVGRNGRGRRACSGGPTGTKSGSPGPTRSTSPAAEATKFDLVAVLPRGRRAPAQHRRRPARHAAALPRRRRPGSPSTKSGSRPGPRLAASDEVSTPNGTTSNALVVADIAHVVWAVNIGCLGLHLWPYRAADPEHADELRIDLDPQPGIGFEEVRVAALRCRDLLDELGMRGYPKTTGNHGLHVYVRLEPRWDSIEVRAAAVALARELERRHPDDITANWWKEERGERGLRRLQPERAAQDRVRRLVRPAPDRRPGLDAALLGGGRGRRCPTS